jgi:hypothetical protein
VAHTRLLSQADSKLPALTGAIRLRSDFKLTFGRKKQRKKCRKKERKIEERKNNTQKGVVIKPEKEKIV